MTLVEMLTGTHPWPNVNVNGHFVYKLMNLKDNEIPEYVLDKEAAEDIKEFLKLTFIIDYTKRPTSKMLLRHPFVSTNKQKKYFFQK